MGADSVRKKKIFWSKKNYCNAYSIFSGVLLTRGVGGCVLETPHHLAPLMNLVGPNEEGRFKAVESKSIKLM